MREKPLQYFITNQFFCKNLNFFLNFRAATKSVKNSVKSAANVVTAVPSNIMHSTYSMVGGIGKALTSGSTKDSNPQLADGKVGAGTKFFFQQKSQL